MFGSTTGGKSGVASAPEKDDEASSKGAKAKEDADRGAACSHHCHDKSTSRETSPQWSLSNLCTRECFALLFGIEVAPTIEDGIGSHILPTYAWSERIISDMLSPTIEDISQVVILNPMECLIFQGRHSKGEGFTYGETLALSDAYYWETTTWIGCRVKMHCVMCTLWDTRGDLRMVRDQEHDKTLEHIQQQYQESEEGGPQTPSHGRGYVCHADRYFAQRFLKKQPERRPGECPAGARDHRSQSREPSHRGWPAQPSSDRPQGLYAHHEMPEKAGQGHPLGGGHPERVPQEFHDSFHSAREDQSDMASDSNSETEDWDDIIAYDEHATAIEPTNAGIMNDACDMERLNSWACRYSETPLQTTPSHTTTGGVM